MMKKLLSSTLFTILLISSLWLLTSTPALAQVEPVPTPTIYLPMPMRGPEFEFQQALQQGEAGGMNKQYFDAKTVEDIMQTIIVAVGGELVEDKNCPPGQQCYRRQGGATAMAGNLVASLYVTQPASSVEYLADLGSRLGLAKPAYAQGFGFEAFSPVLDLWKLFRNIAYLFFVVIFVIIGFMIMFRMKINPQTVIGIQNALPRIVVTLLLITFSYAIAGFIVDIGELTTRIVGNILVNGKILGLGDPTGSLKDLLSSSVFKLVNPLRNVDDMVGAIRNTGVGTTMPKGLSWLAGLTVGVVFWLAGFYIMFKIFFALLGPYVSLILSVIFSPLQLLLGAIPGKDALGGWLKQIIANTIVFPVAFAMLCISAILQSGPTLNKCDPNLSWLGGVGGSALWCTKADEVTQLWTPIGINLGSAIGHIAGFGILFAIPKVTEIIKEALQYKPSIAGVAGAEEIKAAFGRVPFIKGFIS